ncbi:uncharacterized protein LODBEIA_P51970 [Lodderomyces beijingensis]|uniref:Uncharacterized protein n=1 Tax=Lodderomyces beijingensis TaxID=1775926 RepID=A0ABP0ZS60_9ASCO
MDKSKQTTTPTRHQPSLPHTPSPFPPSSSPPSSSILDAAQSRQKSRNVRLHPLSSSPATSPSRSTKHITMQHLRQNQRHANLSLTRERISDRQCEVDRIQGMGGVGVDGEVDVDVLIEDEARNRVEIARARAEAEAEARELEEEAELIELVCALRLGMES